MSKAETIPYTGKEGDGENVAATLAKYADKIADVKSKLAADAKLSAIADDAFVYRFLRFHKFDTTKAAENLSKTLKWREENKMDDIRAKVMGLDQTKWPHADNMAKYNPLSWMHKTDKKGRPCEIDYTGHSRPADFSKEMTLKQFQEFNFYMMERMVGELARLQKEQGVMMRAVQIMDMNGLGLKHLDMGGLAYVESCTNIYTQHYPDFLSEIYIVNAPWLFNTFWRFASSWMSEDVRNGTHVLADVEKLKEYFPAANLPVALGGSCKACVPACVREVDPLAGFTKVDIAGKQPHLLKIDNVEKGSLVSWEYRTSHEIGMGASFVPKGEAKQILVQNLRRRSDLRGIDGGFEAKKDGLLTLAWDNTYDGQAKTVWYQLTIKKADQMDRSIQLDTSGPKTNA